MRSSARAPQASPRLILALVLVLCLAVPALAQAWGELRVVETALNVRKERSPQSPVVRTLMPGERVKVDFLRPSGWGAVFEVDAPERDDAKAIGFADVRLLKPVSGAAAPAPAAAPMAKPQPAAAPAPAPAVVPYRSAQAAAPAAPVLPQAAAPAPAQPAKPQPAPPAPAAETRPAGQGAQAQPAQPQLSQVEARTEVFRERTLKSNVVAVLSPGERIQTAFPRDGFVAVFRLHDSAASESLALGFVPSGMVKPASAAPAPAPATSPAQRPEGKSVAAPELKGEVKESPSLLGGKPSLNTQAPVRITSDKMVYNQAENSVTFLGNVHGTHTDMAIWAARITAYFVDKKKGKDASRSEKSPADKNPAGDIGDKIERIVADGNVRMVANKNEGACAQLTYLVQEGVIRMDGNPILREGQNTIRGESILFHIRENRSEVLSSGQRRVEAIFASPKGDKK